MSARGLLLLALLTSACGDAGEPPLAITITPPSLGEAASCPGTSFGSNARATLHVSGNFAPCALSFTATGEATGVCPQIATGVVRYLVISYGLADPASPLDVLPLLYAYRALDLTPAALEGEPTSLQVTFTDPTVSGVVKSSADIAALPSAPDGSSTGGPLDDARRFARSLIGSDNLDADDDGCANIDEACNNHLFDGTPGC